jgi:hypothetical protein
MVKRPEHRLLVLLAVLCLACTPLAQGSDAGLQLTPDQKVQLDRLFEELRANQVMLKLGKQHRPATLALVGIDVIPMTGEGLLEDQTVIVEGGRFTALGAASDVPVPAGAKLVQAGSGKYLIPGLTEGHAHTQFSLSQYLVYLTRGVTTVREMDGFPWMLRARDMAVRNELLIPNLYVAGHILSHRAWPFYMTQVDTVEEVQRAADEQAAAGYDFIKIHNSMPEPLYSAVFDAAGAHGLEVVGHIPGEILIAEAIAAGQRTNEHFKGYIFDENLTITGQDFVAATAGSDLWNAPSFSNYHEHLRGAQAVQMVNDENSLRLVPGWMRAEWQQQADMPMDGLTELRQSIYPKSREIFTRLSEVTDKFFAGTDTGGYAFQVPGYTLQEEVRIFEDLGLSPYDALKTATINPAIAMRRESEMGAIEVGKRADFVLLGANPLETTENLRAIQGVGVRGTWLDRDALNEIEKSLEKVFADDASTTLSDGEKMKILAVEIQALLKAGFPYPAYLLEEVEEALAK